MTKSVTGSPLLLLSPPRHQAMAAGLVKITLADAPSEWGFLWAVCLPVLL